MSPSSLVLRCAVHVTSIPILTTEWTGYGEGTLDAFAGSSHLWKPWTGRWAEAQWCNHLEHVHGLRYTLSVQPGIIPRNNPTGSALVCL
jgi:hypothetical protein